MAQEYKAYVISEDEGKFTGEFKTIPLRKLSSGEVLIKVHYSSINYKDYLSSIGNKGVTKNYPHVPGIDGAGVVESSQAENISAGQEVLVTGYDLGMNHDGGWAEYVIVPADWVVVLPSGLSLKESMIWGTAGFTAAQCVEALEKYASRENLKEILVTGGSGGVGSIVIYLLAQLGYKVTALTRSSKNDDFLKKLGASYIIDLKTWQEGIPSKKPLVKPLYDGAVDTVGGDTLANILKIISYRGVISCCGMVGGIALNTSVFPFILRGVKLIGIDSAEQPLAVKKALWDKVSKVWKLPDLKKVSEEIVFEKLPKYIAKMEKGEIQGRVVVKIKSA